MAADELLETTLEGPKGQVWSFADFLSGPFDPLLGGVTPWTFTYRKSNWQMKSVKNTRIIHAYKITSVGSKNLDTILYALNNFDLDTDEPLPIIIKVTKESRKDPEPADDLIKDIIVNGTDTPCLLVICAADFPARERAEAKYNPPAPRMGWNPAFVQLLGDYMYECSNTFAEPDAVTEFEPKVTKEGDPNYGFFNTKTAETFTKIATFRHEENSVDLVITVPDDASANANLQASNLFETLYAYFETEKTDREPVVENFSHHFRLPSHSYFPYSPMFNMHVEIFKTGNEWHFKTTLRKSASSAKRQKTGASMRAPFDWATTALFSDQ